MVCSVHFDLGLDIYMQHLRMSEKSWFISKHETSTVQDQQYEVDNRWWEGLQLFFALIQILEVQTFHLGKIARILAG